MIQYSGVMKRFFHWYQIAEAPMVYTAPPAASSISPLTGSARCSGANAGTIIHPMAR